MKNSLALSALAGIVVLAAAGCKSKEAQLEGKWKVKDVTVTGVTGPTAELTKGMMKGSTLELKKDKKFVLTMIVPLEGTWSVSGDNVSLTVSTMMGMSVDQMKAQAKSNPKASKSVNDLDKPIMVTLSPDGKTLTLSPPGAKSTITFEKDTSS